MYQEIYDLLLTWEGKRSDYLTTIYEDYINEEAFFEYLVKMTVEGEDVQVASTWLIKHHYDHKNALNGQLIHQILENCDVLQHWGAKLHILQIFPKIQFPKRLLPILETFVKEQLEAQNKFVRAAAYQAFFELSKSLPELKIDLKKRCELAMETESASIKVKLRRILKKLG